MADVLRVPAAILISTFDVLRECGCARYECVLYWTGPVAAPEVVDGLDHPIHRRSFGGYEIETSWLTSYWFRLAREQRSIRAQVHTHPGSAFHSGTDDHWPVVSVPGFVSIVIPNFAAGPVYLRDSWVGLVDTDGCWAEVMAETAIEFTP